ncbi:hypothetical protein CEXT_604151 [Caerostris extrusa]|uniref:Uncharacterized protein n=1 Tax=Caerostris extrusa TaxID=172846 RepID=A0AAV4TVI6_CAEEX|nr:hypothetical protein CEXT_604151 [Caerostris extrusa]
MYSQSHFTSITNLSIISIPNLSDTSSPDLSIIKYPNSLSVTSIIPNHDKHHQKYHQPQYHASIPNLSITSIPTSVSQPQCHRYSLTSASQAFPYLIVTSIPNLIVIKHSQPQCHKYLNPKNPNFSVTRIPNLNFTSIPNLSVTSKLNLSVTSNLNLSVRSNPNLSTKVFSLLPFNLSGFYLIKHAYFFELN